MVGEAFSWLAGEGWDEYFKLFGNFYEDAAQYRARHLLKAAADLRRNSFW